MVLSLPLPDRYPWVLLAGVGTGWVTAYQTINVSRFREAAGVKYPQLYAEEAEAAANPIAMRFNCAQRAHAHAMETLPQTLFCLLFSGLKYPTTAAALGGLWIVGRVVFTIGYSTGNPGKRRPLFAILGHIGLSFLATWTALELVYPTLPLQWR